MATLRVQSPDAFFECQQTLVDFSTLHSTLTIVTLAVGSALRPRQIDEQKLSNCSTLSVFHLDLADSVGAR